MRPKTPQTSKTKRLVHHNVLFEKWITKAMEEAFTKELKSYHTYKKALSSLRKYPLMLSSGKECRILEGFGPKLCDFLDDMLSKYAAELNMSPAAALLHGNRKATMQASSATTQLNHNVTSVIDNLGRLTSRGLIYSIPDHPGRYRLTDNSPSGSNSSSVVTIADSPLEAVTVEVGQAEDRASGEQKCGSIYLRVNLAMNVLLLHRPVLCYFSSLSVHTMSYPLAFTYANERGEAVQFRSCAHTIRFDSNDGQHESIGFRISCAYEDLIVAGVPYRMDWNAPSSIGTGAPCVFAYLLDPNAPNRSTKLSVRCLSPQLEHPSCGLPDAPVIYSQTNRTGFLIDSTVSTKFQFQRSVSAACAVEPLHADCPVHSSAPTSNPSLSSIQHSEPTSPKRSMSSVLTRMLSAPSSTTHSRLSIPGGTYKLILLVDVREHFGLNRVKQLLPPVLQSLGVNCESRALPVGDFLWIGRWTTASGDQIEAVLDYVVERKRADDLAASIVDGRFQEQKVMFCLIFVSFCTIRQYRMKRTLLAHPICLIEECASMRNQRLPFETLLQAVANCQIIDGFQVMVTRCPEDTVDLLAALTETLHRQCSLDLYICSPSVAKRDSNGSLHGLRWSDFVQLANKSPDPTVRDMFARQLLQIHGCSSCKVAAVLDTYPTPLSLFQAYDSQPTIQAKKSMLASLKVANTNRQVKASSSPS
ncbi:crossover junction endonuclease MUS81 [Paragonimus westermani]|uniref:Crossover junction endonuclease MUS81 n=1 Tax=Paragonimus westermani TaxID=34504 RepID=A0A5J4NIY2_9TREM|nr:crossover junction endonuclease MUS81 [Paragonimus westermani]